MGEQDSDGTTPDQGTTRRNLIRRAAIVGAAAWTLPVVQSVQVKAGTLNGSPPPPLCGHNGDACRTNADCCQGLVCLVGTGAQLGKCESIGPG